MDNIPAILGGKMEIDTQIDPYVTIGMEEKRAVNKVIDEGCLSGFIAASTPEFYGGKYVQQLEKDWQVYFGVKHAISVNSATSGLYAAIAAVGIEPGDEVIVTPTTMTATVTGIVLYQAVPIFADISSETFCIDPEDIKRKITNRTKAIIVVDIYGQSADWEKINTIARDNNLLVIEDAAQAIGGEHNDKKLGTIGDIGIYSLNRHKHIHCGEGGVCVTNNDEFASRLRLIRNHGEALVDDMGVKNIKGIIGFNYRMTEIEAAIATEQLKKLDYYVDQRIEMCHKIIKAFSQIPGIISPYRSSHSKHVYYYLCFKVEKQKLGMSRDSFVEAMNAEGIPLGVGGYKPIYLQSMYKNKIAFGENGQPFSLANNGKGISYYDGLCEVAEALWHEELFYVKVQNYVFTDDQIKKFVPAAKKVLNYKSEIKAFLDGE